MTLRQRLLSHRQQLTHMDKVGDIGDDDPHRFSWAGAGKMLSNILSMSQDSVDSSESRTAQPQGAVEDFPMISPRSALIQGEAFRDGQQVATRGAGAGAGGEPVSVSVPASDNNQQQQQQSYGKKCNSHLQLLFPSEDIETPHVSIYVYVHCTFNIYCMYVCTVDTHDDIITCLLVSYASLFPCWLMRLITDD